MIHELFRLHAALYCFQKLLEEIQEFEANKTYSYHQPVNVVRLFVDKVESIVRDLQSEATSSESEAILQETARLVHEVFFSTDAYTQERFLFIVTYGVNFYTIKSKFVKKKTNRYENESTFQSVSIFSSTLLNDEDLLAMDLLKTSCFCCKSVLLLVRRAIKYNEVGSRENWLSFTYKQVKQRYRSKKIRFS